MTVAITKVSAEELSSYVNKRGYQATPVNGTMGFELTGPRGNRTIVMAHRNGLFPLESAALWCDGVDYSTMAMHRKKMRKAQS